MRPIDRPARQPLRTAGDPEPERAREEWPAGRRPWDGRARDPAELLDNLRLRLADLAANHPSRSPLPAERGSPAGRTAPGERVVPGERVMPGERPDTGAHPGAGDGPPGREPAKAAGQAPAGPGERRDLLGDAMRAARLAVGPADLLDGPGGMPGAAGTLGGAGRLARADPYRPWFMTGEPASPWWAA